MVGAAPQSAVVEAYQCGFKGKGLRAKRNFANEEFIIEYKGELVQGLELQRRKARYEQDKVSISPDPAS